MLQQFVDSLCGCLDAIKLYRDRFGNTIAMSLVETPPKDRIVRVNPSYKPPIQLDLLEVLIENQSILPTHQNKEKQNIFHLLALTGMIQDAEIIIRNTEVNVIQSALIATDIMGLTPIELASLRADSEMMLLFLREVRGISYPYKSLFNIYHSSNLAKNGSKCLADNAPRMEKLLRSLAFDSNLEFDQIIKCSTKLEETRFLLFDNLPYLCLGTASV